MCRKKSGFSVQFSIDLLYLITSGATACPALWLNVDYSTCSCFGVTLTRGCIADKTCVEGIGCVRRNFGYVSLT